MLQNEFDFTLPCGYVDPHGTLHRDGVMRRATALDELEALNHPRVRANEIFLSIFLFSRVIIRLGTLGQIGPTIVEQLFATDFAYLQDLYLRVNGSSSNLVETQCPACGTRIVLDMNHEQRPV